MSYCIKYFLKSIVVVSVLFPVDKNKGEIVDSLNVLSTILNSDQ